MVGITSASARGEAWGCSKSYRAWGALFFCNML